MQRRIQIILVKIANYKSIAGILDIESCYILMKKLAEKMMKAKSEAHLPMDVYYLENGLFSLVTEKDQPDKLKAVAEQISGILSRATEFEKLDIELNSCICIIRCPEDIDNYEKLISFGNTFHTYLPLGGAVNDMSEPKDRRNLNLRNDLDGIISDAIVNKRFEMYYQPIYSINEKRFLSAEALIRLNDETYGFISPELFITAAEKSGMILQIGEYVLDSVCCFLERCGKEGLPVDYIELNLSMSQCMQRELTDKVLYYLNKYNLRPDQVNLEITETAANTAQDVVEENIISLSDKGIYFSLDDYGTGYSNLGRIMELPFRIVKLDKSLADRVGNPRMKILLKNTIHMLKEMGMEIVVEGVETKETLQQFEELGCDFIQGYYFSKPLPEEKYIEFINQSQN